MPLRAPWRRASASLAYAGASSRVSAVYASRVYSLAVPPAHAGRVPRRSIGLSLAAPGTSRRRGRTDLYPSRVAPFYPQ
jgi:hypothetical protein